MRRLIMFLSIVSFLALTSGCILDFGGTTDTQNLGSVAWDKTCTEYRGQNGQQLTYTFPAGGTAYGIWGTDIYTDDSSIGTAAVHAGLITFASGGTVTIEIRAGQASYTGSTRNGVTTSSYGEWSGSFVFVTQ